MHKFQFVTMVAVALTALACGGEESSTRGSGAAAAGGSAVGVDSFGNPVDSFGNPASQAGAGGVVAGAGGAGPLGGGNCEEFYISAEPGIPDFLIVLDKSGSMGGENTPTCGVGGGMMVDCADPANAFNPTCLLGTFGFMPGVDRWTPSVAALKAITVNLEGQMRFGLMTYPGAADQCAPGDVLVTPDFGMAGTIAGSLDSVCPGGATPTAGSLLSTQDVFANMVINPDAQKGVPYVLLVTDGAPNCAGGGGGGGGFGMGDEQGSYDAVTTLADAGIRTYVIGYDTQSDANLSGVLDEMARRGNTGDMAHRPVEDEAGLVAEFQQIAQTAVSCSYKLDEMPGDPSFVLVSMDGAKVPLNDPNGWSLNGDSIVLQGSTCSTLQDGGTHTLDVQVKCVVVNPD